MIFISARAGLMRSAPRCMINHPNASGFWEHETPSFANPLLLDILLFNFQYPKTNSQRPIPNYQSPKAKAQLPKTKDQRPKAKDQRPYYSKSILTPFYFVFLLRIKIIAIAVVTIPITKAPKAPCFA